MLYLFIYYLYSDSAGILLPDVVLDLSLCRKREGTSELKENVEEHDKDKRKIKLKEIPAKTVVKKIGFN